MPILLTTIEIEIGNIAQQQTCFWTCDAHSKKERSRERKKEKNQYIAEYRPFHHKISKSIRRNVFCFFWFVSFLTFVL